MNKKIAFLCIGLTAATMCASEPDYPDKDASISSYVLGYALANTVLKYYQDFRTIGRGPEWLFDAVEKNNMPKMNLLLFFGVDPNTKETETSPLVMAAFKRNTYAVERLLQYGAVDNPKTKKIMALHACFTPVYYDPTVLLALLKNRSGDYIPEKVEPLRAKALADLKTLTNNLHVSPPDDDLWPLPYGKGKIPNCADYMLSCYMFGLRP